MLVPPLTLLAPPPGSEADYDDINPQALTPSAAVATIFDVKH